MWVSSQDKEPKIPTFPGLESNKRFFSVFLIQEFSSTTRGGQRMTTPHLKHNRGDSTNLLWRNTYKIAKEYSSKLSLLFFFLILIYITIIDIKSEITIVRLQLVFTIILYNWDPSCRVHWSSEVLPKFSNTLYYSKVVYSIHISWERKLFPLNYFIIKKELKLTPIILLRRLKLKPLLSRIVSARIISLDQRPLVNYPCYVNWGGSEQWNRQKQYGHYKVLNWFRS